MRLLLITRRVPESLRSFMWAVNRVFRGRRAINPPLGLVTLTALRHANWDAQS